MLVVDEDGAPVGFVAFGPAEDEPKDLKLGEVYAIYLDSAHWGRGYGRSLFGAAMDGLRGATFSDAVLWVLDTNVRARRFYEKAGWTTDGQTKTEQRGEVILNDVRYRRSLAD